MPKRKFCGVTAAVTSNACRRVWPSLFLPTCMGRGIDKPGHQTFGDSSTGHHLVDHCGGMIVFCISRSLWDFLTGIDAMDGLAG